MKTYIYGEKQEPSVTIKEEEDRLQGQELDYCGWAFECPEVPSGKMTECHLCPASYINETVSRDEAIAWWKFAELKDDEELTDV